MNLDNTHHNFATPQRVSQSLRSDRCQNILFKAVFEHFIEIKDIAALLLTSKSFQNSSFGANFIVNFVLDKDTIALFESVLSPSSCFSVQFVHSIDLRNSTIRPDQQVDPELSSFVAELAKTKYLHLQLRSLVLIGATPQLLHSFLGTCSTSWPRLDSLDLLGSVVSDADFNLISTATPQLRNLNLGNSVGVTDVGLEHISKISGMTSLDLSLASCCDEITDAGLLHIAKLSHISSLNLHGCDKITDVGIERITVLISIKLLDLGGCKRITDFSLWRISKLRNIKFLILENCALITDVGLKYIFSELFDMETLSLAGCYQISDAGMECVANLSILTDFNLSECDLITDEGLEHISQCSKILKLNIQGCFEISEEARFKFMENKPGIIIWK